MRLGGAALLAVLAGTGTGAGADAETRFVALARGTPVLDGPETTARTVSYLARGIRVDVQEHYSGYALIALPSGGTAWVSNAALSTQPPVPRAARPQAVAPYASVVWTRSGPLNMRAGPGTGHAVLGQCQRGDWVEVTAKAGRWSEVRLADGAHGWVHSAYLTR